VNIIKRAALIGAATLAVGVGAAITLSSSASAWPIHDICLEGQTHHFNDNQEADFFAFLAAHPTASIGECEETTAPTTAAPTTAASTTNAPTTTAKEVTTTTPEEVTTTLVKETTTTASEATTTTVKASTSTTTTPETSLPSTTVKAGAPPTTATSPPTAPLGNGAVPPVATAERQVAESPATEATSAVDETALPVTGASPGWIAAFALAFVAAGVALSVCAARRREVQNFEGVDHS
jgi:hypothetical protein